jgi:plastocyanin
MSKRSRWPARLAVLALAVVPVAAAGCGSDNKSSSSSSESSSSSGTTASAPVSGPGGKIDVSETDFALSPANPTVKPGTVTINATNDGQTVHAIEIEGPKGEVKSNDLSPGGKATVTAELPPGTYEWYCPIANHKDLGMKGEITVK